MANDGEANQLWVNRGDGTFRDEAALRGVAVSGEGRAQAGMGIGVGDALGRGSVDLYVTHLANEHNALYLAGDRGLFADAAFDSGLARLDLQMTGFGCGFLDVELDGDLDLAIANGRVYIGPPMADTGLGPFWSRLAEPDMLLLNLGTSGSDTIHPASSPMPVSGRETSVGTWVSAAGSRSGTSTRTATSTWSSAPSTAHCGSIGTKLPVRTLTG